jgi:predicted GNAT family acetyltransferase
MGSVRARVRAARMCLTSPVSARHPRCCTRSPVARQIDQRQTRTIELGDYLGVRCDGALVAMAGERFRLDGWTEISAVCTKPGYRGRGLASRLIGALTAGIQLRSQRVFLHVLSTNTGAIRIYEELGFRVRQTAAIIVVTHDSQT